MASVYDQLSTSSNKSSAMSSSASRRTSTINSLLNPVSDEQASPSYQDNVDWYEPEDQPSLNQNWRRYSAPTLISESLSTSNTDNNHDLTIINYCNDKSSSQQSQVDSAVSQSMPTSPMSKHSENLSLEYNRISNNAEKASKRSTSSSLPSSRRSSMNRSSGSGQDVTSSNMMTPPQTPGIKSPTKANFSFPPSSNGTSDCDQQNSQQIMPPKVKRKRITQEQLQDLVAMFEQTDTPSYDVREKLAKKLNMTNREVQVWFQNRRAKANRAKANEHNASHQHHRFLHHHSVTTAQAASGHASSINMMPHGNFTFVPMFTNGGPSPTGGPVRGRSNRRHSYVPPTNNNQKKVSQNTPLTRPRASTVTGAPMTSMSSHVSHVGPHSIHVGSRQQSAQKMMIPAPIKIISSYDHHLHGISHHPGYYHSHSVPPSPVSPMTPMTPMTPLSPTTPTLPPINYMLSGINNLTLPPPIPPKSDYQQSSYQAIPSHNSHQQQSNMLSAFHPGYSDTTTIKSEPSPIDLLATAAELVQSEEKEKERLRALTINNNAEEETGNDKKWRPWLV